MNYLSYSSLSTYAKDPEEFYLKYFTEVPSFEQTFPMAIGSAFDAIIKADLTGEDVGPLFEQQISHPDFEKAIEAGWHCMECYQKSGAYDSLRMELDGFEIYADIDEVVNIDENGHLSPTGTPVRRKPDLLATKGEITIIVDWKVNGYASRNSRVKGTTNQRFYWPAPKKVWDKRKFTPFNIPGYGEISLDEPDKQWSRQLHTYSAGSISPILGIDQLTWQGDDFTCGVYRWSGCKHEIYGEFAELWHKIQTNTVLSSERQQILQQRKSRDNAGSFVDKSKQRAKTLGYGSEKEV